MISCPLCTKTYRDAKSLDLHMVSHTKEKPYKCLKCSSAFGRESSLKEHVRGVHDGIKQIKNRNSQCPICSYKCYSKAMLDIHSRKHSAEQPFSCSIHDCGFKTKYKNCLKQHVHAVHSMERPLECPSEGCSYKAKTKGHLKSHLRIHSNEKPFACQVLGCNYTCKTKSYLAGHASRAHSDERPLQCSACEFRAKNRPNLIQHQLTHVKVRRFQCQAPNCGFSSHQKSKLKRHFDSMHRKKEVLCTESGCHFRCGSITLLKIHLKRHELPVWKCSGYSCSYSTKSKTSLVQHIAHFHKYVQSATGIGSSISDLDYAGTAGTVDIIHCSFPDCGFQTKFPHHYDRHRKTHNKKEKRKHVCTFCFSRFSHLCVLKAHVQRHVGEKPYSCPFCKYTAVDSFELVKHARRAHHVHVIPRGKEDEVKKCHTCGRSCLSYSEFVLHSMIHLKPVVILEPLKLHIL